MEQIVIYLLMVQRLLNLKQKILKLFPYLLCLGNISKDCTNDNMKKKQDLMVKFMTLVLIRKLLQPLIF